MNISKTMLALFAGALLLSSISGSAAAASQTWYLGGEFDLVANRGSVPDPVTDPEFPTNRIDISNGQSAVWEANEAALVNVDFGTGDFSWSLRLASGNFIGQYHVEIGTSDCNGNFVPNNEPVVLVNGPGLAGQQVQSGLRHVTDFVVSAGSCLAFRVVNDADAEGKVLRVMFSVPDSRFTSTDTDPGYPTPELGTVLLTGAGIGLVALVVARRR